MTSQIIETRRNKLCCLNQPSKGEKQDMGDEISTCRDKKSWNLLPNWNFFLQYFQVNWVW